MAFKRRKSRKRKRTRRKRKRKSKMQKISVGRWPTSFPDTLLVKQRYSSSLVWSAASTFNQVYTINNMNDVDATAVGSQFANMTDQLTELYSRFKVHGCKITVKAINLSTTEGVRFTLSAQNSATPVSYRETMENPYSKNWYLGVEQGGHNVTTRSMYISLKKLAGENLLGHSYDGSVGADPGIIFHWILQGDSIAGGNMTAEVEVTLVYYLRWYHRQLVPISTGPAVLDNIAE